jgi:hypothetical protein
VRRTVVFCVAEDVTRVVVVCCDGEALAAASAVTAHGRMSPRLISTTLTMTVFGERERRIGTSFWNWVPEKGIGIVPETLYNSQGTRT